MHKGSEKCTPESLSSHCGSQISSCVTSFHFPKGSNARRKRRIFIIYLRPIRLILSAKPAGRASFAEALVSQGAPAEMMADSDAAASVVADEKVGGAEKFVKDSTSTETLPSMPDSAASEEVVLEETGAPEASEKAPIELRKIFVGGLSFQTTEAELVVRTHPAHPPAPTIAHQTARMRSHAEMPPPRSNSRVPAGVLRAVRGN